MKTIYIRLITRLSPPAVTCKLIRHWNELLRIRFKRVAAAFVIACQCQRSRKLLVGANRICVSRNKFGQKTSLLRIECYFYYWGVAKICHHRVETGNMRLRVIENKLFRIYWTVVVKGYISSGLRRPTYRRFRYIGNLKVRGRYSGQSDSQCNNNCVSLLCCGSWMRDAAGNLP